LIYWQDKKTSLLNKKLLNLDTIENGMDLMVIMGIVMVLLQKANGF